MRRTGSEEIGASKALGRGLQGRSATGLNGQAAKEEVSALWREGWMPENISGVPAGRSVFHLTSPFIGLLARVTCPDCGALSVDSSCPSKLLRLRRFEDVGPD